MYEYEKSIMHEYLPTKSIIDFCNKYAKEQGISKIEKINLVIGDSHGFVQSSMELYFDIIAENTPCEGAVLCIDRPINKKEFYIKSIEV
ncbi:MAG: hydrogenase maturation nickel metallochaperone HypA [Ruminococcus sp.]|jgi:hydrogenase nickel incorporation protein HypA/HybF|nr:hydrogenase maturation nickel metallochaperone HypA [Ruminococcus sp.]